MDSRFESQFYLDEIEYQITYRVIDIRWYMVGFSQSGQKPMVCENCGHPIHNLFSIASNTGRHLVVGSECVKSLCDGEQRATAEKLERRATRAAGQWRKNNPARAAGETRQEYITRRIIEMRNALKAHKAWTALSSYHFMGRADRRQLAINARARKLFGIQTAGREGYYATDNTPFSWRDLLNADIRRVERKYKANRYDFNRATWEVAKI